eukprot:gene11852-biopygen3255
MTVYQNGVTHRSSSVVNMVCERSLRQRVYEISGNKKEERNIRGALRVRRSNTVSRHRCGDADRPSAQVTCPFPKTVPRTLISARLASFVAEIIRARQRASFRSGVGAPVPPYLDLPHIL